MTTISHKNLTTDQLHEPKGIYAAAAGTTYVADGAGSGTWTSAGFSTGDVKATIKTTADSGWVLMDDGTIGNASSVATTRANADTEDLFTLLWNNVSDTYAAVSSGRGASAAADYAANKTIALPKALGRVLGGYGAGSGLTSRSMGETGGADTLTISQANLPSVNLTTSIASGQGSHTHVLDHNTGVPTTSVGGTVPYGGGSNAGTSNVGISSATLPAMTGTTPLGGSGTAISMLQPSVFLNFMIKL